MRPVAFVLVCSLLALAPSVRAAEKEAPKSAPIVVLEPVALPIIVDGKLINYVFCTVRLDLAPNADSTIVRNKEQYFRDDLVRAGHRTPFTRADDYAKVDEARIRAELLRFAPSVVGPGVVVSATLIKQVSTKQMGRPPAPQKGARDIVP